MLLNCRVILTGVCVIDIERVRERVSEHDPEDTYPIEALHTSVKLCQRTLLNTKQCLWGVSAKHKKKMGKTILATSEFKVQETHCKALRADP